MTLEVNPGAESPTKRQVRDLLNLDHDDLVARRILMRREVWDRLVAASEAVSDSMNVSPADLAALCIEKGVEAIAPASKVAEAQRRRRGRKAAP